MTRIYHLVDGTFICRVSEKGREMMYLSMDLDSMDLTCHCKVSSFFPWMANEVSTFCSRAEKVSKSLSPSIRVLTERTWKQISNFLDGKFDFDSEDLPF